MISTSTASKNQGQYMYLTIQYRFCHLFPACKYFLSALEDNASSLSCKGGTGKKELFHKWSCIWLFFIGPESDHWLCLSLTNSLTDSVTLSKLYWCDPGVWRCQLKTYWGCCWCWWWGSCWQQFVSDLEAEVWSKSLSVVQTLSTRFGQDFEVEI